MIALISGKFFGQCRVHWIVCSFARICVPLFYRHNGALLTVDGQEYVEQSPCKGVWT